MPIGHYPTYQIFLAAPLFSVHLSFACRHLACHILDYTRNTFKNKTDNMINNPQNLSGVNARLEL